MAYSQNKVVPKNTAENNNPEKRTKTPYYFYVVYFFAVVSLSALVIARTAQGMLVGLSRLLS